MAQTGLNGREELAWAAGFFDGEGHVGLATVNKRKGGNSNKHLHIQLVQTLPGPLERFQEALGGKMYGPYRSSVNGRRPYKQLHFDTFERVQNVACRLWPWLSRPKKDQFKAALLAYHEYLARPYVKRGPQKKESQV
jgi:hypothetical protein